MELEVSILYSQEPLQCVLAAKILTVDFVVCTLAVKKKIIRAGFDMSDRTIPLSDRASDPVPEQYT
jgi:hypothetical protein